MKKEIKWMFGMLMFLFSIGVNAQNAKGQKVEFTSDINEMTPMSFPSRSALSGFSFDMRGDSAFVHLPYMGEVYNPTFSNDGLNFEEPCTELTVTQTKKKDGRRVILNVRHDIVTYKFTVTLWDGGRIDIFMQPSNAQCCSYMGDWSVKGEK